MTQIEAPLSPATAQIPVWITTPPGPLARGTRDLTDLTMNPALPGPPALEDPEAMETATGVDPPRKFQRAKDEKAQDNMLVYAALVCAAGAGIIYYA